MINEKAIAASSHLFAKNPLKALRVRDRILRRGLAGDRFGVTGLIIVASALGGTIGSQILGTISQHYTTHTAFHFPLLPIATLQMEETKGLGFGVAATDTGIVDNYTWIRDVQNRLAALEGTEALIEGFGASSGRLGGV